MLRLLRPMVLLLLAAATAALPAVPLDLLFCRCTGTLTTAALPEDCCGPPAPAASCCGGSPIEPCAPVLAGGSDAPTRCMLSFHVKGTGDPLSAARNDASPDAPPTLAAPCVLPRLPAPALAGDAAPAGSRGPALPAPPAAHLRI